MKRKLSFEVADVDSIRDYRLVFIMKIKMKSFSCKPSEVKHVGFDQITN